MAEENAHTVVAVAVMIAAILLSMTIYLSAQNIQAEFEKLALRLKPVDAGSDSSGKEVVLDFLYADWCAHCSAMKPIVANLTAKLPAERFEVRYWNEAHRGNDTAVKAIYDQYGAAGYFEAFPTFVINGKESKMGAMSESDFKAWVCSKFASPKPAGC